MHPSEAKSLPELVELAASSFGEKTAVEDQGKTINFIQLCLDSKKASLSLQRLGIKRGHKVCIWAPNCYEWIIIAIAIQNLGAVLVPLNTRLKGKEASYILKKSEVEILFTMKNFLGKDYSELLKSEDLGNLKETIFLDKKIGSSSWQDFLRLAGDETIHDIEFPKEDDIADIIFTSGTTGNPKGVMVSQGQNIKVFETWSRHVGLKEGDRYLIVNPFFHTFGYKAGWLSCLMRGAVIFPHQVFDADSVLQKIEEKQITVLPGPPTLFQTILSSPNFNSFNISSLKLAITGAASIPVQLIKDMQEIMGFEIVLTAYGLTETTGVVTMCLPGDDPFLIANTSGKAIEGVEVKCLDKSGKEVETGEPGEIHVKGYNVMVAYYQDKKETKETINSEGWLKTGDIGILDSSGYLKITDRSKDMFTVGGFNTYPAEIENILSKHKEIVLSAVIGKPDKRLGEVAKAYVVLKEESQLNEVTLIDWCKDNMANYKVPREIVFVKELPLNAAGKVMKFKLRESE